MRKTYERNFKLKVCKSIETQESTVGSIVKEYEISRPIISRWLAEYYEYGSKSFCGNGNKKPDKMEIYVLEKRIKELEIENNILKKFEHFVK